MSLYRSLKSDGWMEVHGEPLSAEALEGWRPATRQERIWRYVSKPRFSFIDYTIILLLVLGVDGILGIKP